MAIDTKEKRASVTGIHMIGGPGVTPNSGQDQEWRQEAGYGYPGIAADAPGGGGNTGFYYYNWRRRAAMG